ncbi:hydroxyacylglutathione hydrolase [Ascodesmis nigricans]|uniref:hydroxyacylglutathione hydrolase n=1 Tax=Ascodesmis nigricans TaxID=341454 RepID=A0A4S2MZ69_9PEZI|nr:hydroxyacylglutathione hydrolase [Ascodesmis nigricans]
MVIASLLRPAVSRCSGFKPNLKPLVRKMHIEAIPMWTGSHNNYAYLIIDEKTKDSMIVDPAHPPEVLPVLQQHISSGGINFKGIINTHHHGDHAGGNKDLLKQFPGSPVVGGKDCAHVTKTPTHKSTFNIGSITLTALHTPCHTQDSICYYAVDGDQKAVFTGDTLFVAGCGRFFEGNAKEMNKALNEVLAALPDDTKVYPGHEYTKSNIRFGKSVLDSEPVQKLSAFCEENDRTEGKFTIGDEKNHNVFMRLDDPTIQKATGKTDPVEVMAKLREMKNNFK